MTYYPGLTPEQARDQQQKENTEINRDLLWKVKQAPCTDCGLKWHPLVMTFDHIDRTAAAMKLTPKGRPVNINAQTYWNPVAFRKQLKLLEVVCKNCHFLREMKRDLNNPMFPRQRRGEMLALMKRCEKGALMS